VKKVLSIIAVLSLAACATSQVGNKYDSQKASSFKIGKSTYSEVIKALGNPSTESDDNSGNKVIEYSYSGSSVKATSYIPFVGAFIGGSNSETHVAEFAFNHRLILTSKTVSNVVN
jgi:outer membrane protein assembly factor BamE (lipoprotein component of BamABCDE complex)